MAQYKITICVESDNAAEVQNLGNFIQNAVSVVDNKDMMKLLSKVKSNPKIVKTALKFI